MPNIVFTSWTITPTQAAVGWTVFPDGVTTIDRVTYRVWRDIDTPVIQSTTALTHQETLNVTNFAGTVFAEVQVYDTQNTVTTRITEFAVNNLVKPTSPDWLTFSAFTATSLTVQWGAAYVAPVNTTWRLYHRNSAGITALLGTYPVTQTSTNVLVSTVTLHDLFVVGVDATGVESVPSPLLDFAPSATGPIIAFTPWVITPIAAAVSFTVTSTAGLRTVNWILKQAGAIVLTGTDAGTVTLPVTNYQGVLELTVLATDTAATAQQVKSTVQIWNAVPRSPVVTVQAISYNSIRLYVDHDPTDSVTAPYADLTGLALTLRESVPFVQTYTNLQPDTEYVFSARAVNPGGLLGPSTQPLRVRTYTAVDVLPPLPGALVPGPILSQLMTWLVGDLLNYFLQVATDTRVRNPLSAQVAKRPVTLYPFLDMVEPVAQDLGRIMREETNDQASYDTSLVIDRAGDTVQKISVLCERLTYGSIINKAF